MFACLGTLILISQMHQVTKDVGLNCSCEVFELACIAVSQWKRPELCR